MAMTMKSPCVSSDRRDYSHGRFVMAIVNDRNLKQNRPPGRVHCRREGGVSREKIRGGKELNPAPTLSPIGSGERAEGRYLTCLAFVHHNKAAAAFAPDLHQDALVFDVPGELDGLVGAGHRFAVDFD